MSSRRPRTRSTSRVGQMHLCAVCIENAGGYGVSEDGHSKQLTWMFEIPPESDTYARLGGRARTWFCKPCFKRVCVIDQTFAARNQDLELKDPAWWTHPATEAQISYLVNLLDQRMIPRDTTQRDRRPHRKRHERRSRSVARQPQDLTVGPTDHRRPVTEQHPDGALERHRRDRCGSHHHHPNGGQASNPHPVPTAVTIITRTADKQAIPILSRRPHRNPAGGRFAKPRVRTAESAESARPCW